MGVTKVIENLQTLTVLIAKLEYDSIIAIVDIWEKEDALLRILPGDKVIVVIEPHMS